MAEFGQYLQSFKPYQPFSEVFMNMEMIKQFPELNPNLLENFNIVGFSAETSLAHHHHHHQPEFPATYPNNFFSTFQLHSQTANVPALHIDNSYQDAFHDSKKRKVLEQSTSSYKNISPAASTTDSKKKNNSRRGKKGKNNCSSQFGSDKEQDKTEEVIHVRARRGQATDSHSLAERVRREKINNKLRCLQDLVPGCHKTMGMAVMLEEIINYVHSLQNQVEFLSMELAAASRCYDLSLETGASKKSQGTSSFEAAQEMEKWARERYGDHTLFNSTWSL